MFDNDSGMQGAGAFHVVYSNVNVIKEMADMTAATRTGESYDDTCTL